MDEMRLGIIAAHVTATGMDVDQAWSNAREVTTDDLQAACREAMSVATARQWPSGVGPV